MQTATSIPWGEICPERSAFQSAAKRLLDVLLSAVLLLLAAPLLLVLMLLIRLTSPGPALFRQGRIGFRCRQFRMVKLRTMVDRADQLEEALARRSPERRFFKLQRDPRITRLGRFLRKWSLDELPQLYNVLRGDMSLVGPRPLLLSDFRKFPRSMEMRRFAVKPGLTGLWQVSGRSECSDEERLRLDLEYVDELSLWNDLKILARTPLAVLRARGAV